MHFCKLWIRSNLFASHISTVPQYMSHHVQVTCIYIFIIQFAIVFVAAEPAKLKHDLFLSLTKCFLCLNLNQTISLKTLAHWKLNIRKCEVAT